MEKIELGTPDGAVENIEKIAKLFPQVVTEVENTDGELARAVDFDALRDLLGDVAEGQRERYQFTWPGKREAKAEVRRPIYKTMIPEPGKSKDWGTTENLYIEGDNLDALKILKETYAGKVKLIYIDPPYNTGHDFIYDDDFAKTRGEYDAESGDYDDEGGRLVANTEGNGRFHSDWCSMIYPRLTLARDLLAADGAIFISIDDNELTNLRKIADEIFGADNHLSTVVWEKTRKNDSRFFSNGHEYICVYAKSKVELINRNTYWREEKDGGKDIAEEYERLLRTYGTDYAAMENELKRYFRNLPKEHPAKKYSRYSHIDETGIWRDDNMSWPGGGGPRYEVRHPITGKPCAVPQGGWRYSTPEKMKEAIEEGKVIFREDETEPPIRKTFLIRKNGRFSDDEGIGKQVKGSYFYRSSLQASTVMDDLFGARVFDYPKDHEVIKSFIQYVVPDNGIVFDFFSGSASTAHAVMEANYEDGGRRQFLMVQIPEPCQKDTVAFKNGYHTICDLGEERIRRAGAKIAADIDKENEQLKLGAEPKPYPDLGFRVLRIGSSNFKDSYLTPGEISQESLFDFADNVKEGRSDLDLLFEVLPKLGIPYSAKIEERMLAGKKVFFVDGDKLTACFDANVGSDTIEEMAKAKPWYAVIRDSSMADDATHANYEELFRTYSPDTAPQVI